MRRPRLDQDHVAGHQAGGVGPAPRVGSAPEDDGSIVVGRVAEDLVELHCESVEVADVQWAEVGVEGVV